MVLTTKTSDMLAKKHNIYDIITQSGLQRWFREKHNIHIIVDIHLSNGYGLNIAYYYITKKKLNDIHFDILTSKHDEFNESFSNWITNTAFKTYEDALEVALQKSFNLIK